MKKFKQLMVESGNAFSTLGHLATLGILGALGVVLSLVASIDLGPYIRIGFSGIPNRIVDFLFGPIVGGIFGGIMDVLKYMVKPNGPFFFGFTLDAILGGVIYGIFLYKKPLKWWRVFIPEVLVKVFINCGLNTLWVSMLYGKGFMALLPARVIKNAIMLPIDTVILFVALGLLLKILRGNRNSRNYTYPFEKEATNVE
ncbi:MAG: folate family ECF transporter S component [Lachnospiraceae bacterium]|nr:folate family ECF transporter S component [Lachnospiraceae bacterium]